MLTVWIEAFFGCRRTVASRRDKKSAGNYFTKALLKAKNIYVWSASASTANFCWTCLLACAARSKSRHSIHAELIYAFYCQTCFTLFRLSDRKSIWPLTARGMSKKSFLAGTSQNESEREARKQFCISQSFAWLFFNVFANAAQRNVRNERLSLSELIKSALALSIDYSTSPISLEHYKFINESHKIF